MTRCTNSEIDEFDHAYGFVHGGNTSLPAPEPKLLVPFVLLAFGGTSRTGMRLNQSNDIGVIQSKKTGRDAMAHPGTKPRKMGTPSDTSPFFQ